MLKDAKDSTARYKEAPLNEPRKSEKEKEKRKKENKKKCPIIICVTVRRLGLYGT
ncbi:hypothetical protein ACRRTK_024310 [Alexandromys fortis]